MEIDKNLLQEIKDYCKLNGIKDVKTQVNSCLRYGFNVLKFGDNPFTYHNPMDDIKNNVEEKIQVIDEHRGNEGCINTAQQLGEDVLGAHNGRIEQSASLGNERKANGDTEKKESGEKKPKRKVRIIKN